MKSVENSYALASSVRDLNCRGIHLRWSFSLSLFDQRGSSAESIFSFDPGAPDEGVRTFFASQNDPISLEPIQAGAYTELVLGNYYGFDPGVPFYLGFYTGHINAAPPGGYSDPLFGWGEFVNNQGVIQMLDSALEVEGGGIYAGTQTIIPIPEPGVISLLACGAMVLGWRSLFAFGRHRSDATHAQRSAKKTCTLTTTIPAIGS